MAKAPPASSKCDEVRCLIDSSAPCCKKSSGGAASSSEKESSRGGGDAKAGKGLEKMDMMEGMSGRKSRVMACNEQYKVAGTVQVKIVVLPNGAVASAEVTGKFAGSPTGACVERAVKGARFKKTTAQSSFTYPFLFR